MIIYYFVNFFIGSCLASHIHVIYDRFNNKNFILSRSECNNCHTTLNLLDEIPILSYLILQGRCRYCKESIPSELFLTELIGGWAFITCNFHSIVGIRTAIITCSLLICAIFDYYTQEFPTIFIIPASIVAIFNFSLPTLPDLVQFIPIFLILCYYAFKKQLGSGDLLIYLILTIYFDPNFANYVFLIAAIIFLIDNLLIKKIDTNQPTALVPYLFLSLILQLLQKSPYS